MRSSSGEHYLALDHVRALAAFMVFCWHFVHTEGNGLPFEYTPAIFPFALLDEGHTGVALFMTLSGYLFAKLLNGRAILYHAFLWNRVLRLVPLLVVVMLLAGVQIAIRGDSLRDYTHDIAAGFLQPTWPNGGWSITVEMHYYVLLPLFLWLARRSRWLPFVLVIAGLTLRTWLFMHDAPVQWFAYWTIAGRVDQFALGMLAFIFRDNIADRNSVAISGMALFCAAYWLFDRAGGYYGLPDTLKSVWIVLPTVEGCGYGLAIAWYDSSFAPLNRGLSAVIGRIGAYSYSLYLLHWFVVHDMARWVHTHVMPLWNFYVACAWALAAFLCLVPAGYLSYRYIEAPFLRLRRRYTCNRSDAALPE